MNYVRKLGFEETPDYDFLRELFTKVLKTLGEQEDGQYDWMLLNGGKGLEAGHVSRLFSAYRQFTSNHGRGSSSCIRRHTRIRRRLRTVSIANTVRATKGTGARRASPCKKARNPRLPSSLHLLLRM